VEALAVSRARLAGAVLVLGLAAGLGGCATTEHTIYGWGSYEDIVYVAAVNPGSVTPEAQIQIMEKEREVIRAGNQRFPPGWHGHLAYLYAQSGQGDPARAELIAEKTAFPESTVFCDTLLRNLDAKTEPKP
jgi:hypothetical protein